MRLKHPAVVREELLEDHAHGEDEQEPQHGAEEHGRHQHLTLRAHGLSVGGDREKGYKRMAGLYEVCIETTHSLTCAAVIKYLALCWHAGLISR